MAIRNLAFAAPILFCVPDSLLCAQGVGGPYWTLDGTQPQGNLGESVASAGDVNGDGYADVLVGEPDYNNGPVPSCGRVMLFLGSRLGLSATPSWIQLGPTAYASFGIAISSAGDVNADGFDDVIIGTPFVLSNEGQCYLFLGSPVGLGSTPATVLNGGGPHLNFGKSVAAGGDLNGDGYGDVIVGRGRSGRCAALVVLGSPTGLLTTPWWTGTSSPTAINFATSLASAGDVNNDGYLDIIAGDFSANQSAGAAYLFLNSPTGLASTPQVLQEASMLSIGFFGFSIAAAGDVNADGYSDVVVGARSFATGSEREGAAFVYLGNPSGLSTVSTSLGNVGARRGMDFGWNVAGRGDLNADGYDDVLVSAPGFVTPLLGQVGRVYAYFGSPSGVSVQPQWFTDGLHQDARIGNGLSYAGDVDSDGFDDLLVGAPYFGLQGDFAGQVTLYQGLGPLLAASTSTVSLLSGGTVQLQVTAGSRMANKAYFLLGTGSGTTPGTPFGGSVIPLNFDPYFVLTASAQAGLLSGGLGLIDGSSRATAQFIVPPNTNPAFLGLTLHHACLLFDLPGSTALIGVSHPIALTAVP